MRPFRANLQGTQYLPWLTQIIENAKNDWLRSLGKNDFQHSTNIERILDTLVPDHIKNDDNIFDPGEIFLLLASVYLHDIGRYQKKEPHEITSREMILSNYSSYHLQNAFVAEAVSQICAAHAAEAVWPIEKCNPEYGILGFTQTGRPCNLRRLGALLRISDELENSFRRVQGVPGQESSIRHLVRDITPRITLGVIEIQATPTTWEELDRLQGMAAYTQRRLREVSRYLEEMRLPYYQVFVNPGVDFAPPLRLPATTPESDDFVETVSLLLQSSYSRVEPFAQIGDVTVSALCVHKTLGLEWRIAVLASPIVSKSLAYEFRGTLNRMKDQRLIDRGLVICAELPSSDVTDLLQSQECGLQTVQSLLQERYDFTPFLQKTISRYESTELFSRNIFITPSGTTDSGTRLHNLLEHLDNWTDSDAGAQFTLLGDFGTGKTTLCEKFAYNLSVKALVREGKARIPIVIPLRNLDCDSVESGITSVLANQLGVCIDFATFDVLNRAGRFVIICDGFDELPRVSTESQVLNAFRQLDKLVQQRAKVVITCRTHFFKDSEHVKTHLKQSSLRKSVDGKFGYDMVHVDPFSQEQVFRYLQLCSLDSAESHMETISRVYNLADLATRPVLLSIIEKTISQVAYIEGAEINSATLYNMYVRFWLDRDDWRSQMDAAERLELAVAMSSHFRRAGVTMVHFRELPDLLNEWTFGKSQHTMETVDLELRTCNFLRRDAIGNYSFVHKSFWEYFLAHCICSQAFDSDSDVSVPWIIQEEQTSGLHGRAVATKEVSEFALQIASSLLREMHPEQILAKFSAKRRAMRLVTSWIVQCHFKQLFSVICSWLLVTDDSETEILRAVENSSDRTSFLLALLSTVTEIGSHGEVGGAAWRIHQYISEWKLTEQESALSDEIQSVLETHEDVCSGLNPVEATEATEDVNQQFSREKMREQLARAVAGLENAEEIRRARAKCFRDWHNRKAIAAKRKAAADREHERERKEIR